MENYIEELMKAAEVKPYKHSYFECKGGRSTICLCPQIGDPDAWCKDECEEMQEKVEYLYPSFTPSKQLELIKLIGKELISLNYRQNEDFYAMQVNSVNRYLGIYKEADTFEELLADIIIELIKFGELDKSEVKRILEVGDYEF